MLPSEFRITNLVVRLLSSSLSAAFVLNVTLSLPMIDGLVLLPQALFTARPVGVLGVSLYSVEMVMFLLPLSNCFQYRSLDSLPALKPNVWLVKPPEASLSILLVMVQVLSLAKALQLDE